jgi:Domain of unknown function (DUF6894)
MARFFFHVSSTFKDEVGEDCSSLESARAYAAKIASELSQDEGYERCAVLVTDERGNVVAHVPIGKAAN